jgi:FKBP-type peptidyl-prolyl cis-trans isomerase
MDSQTKCMASVLFVLTAACSSGGGTPSPAPAPVSAPPSASSASATATVDDEVTRTTFAPDLGTVAASTRTATVRYVGYLSDGKKFDSGDITITLGTNKVIRAWEDGVLGMRVGGKRRLVTPPHLAYGSRGAPPAIPPNAVLVFDMELLQVY